jgi:hypothetical protein
MATWLSPFLFGVSTGIVFVIIAGAVAAIRKRTANELMKQAAWREDIMKSSGRGHIEKARWKLRHK